MTQAIKGPYSLASREPIIIDGVVHQRAVIMRENHGALIIMAPHPDTGVESDRLRIATVDLTIDVKRGQGWSVTAEEDPVQMATARVLCGSWAMYEMLKDVRDTFECLAADDDDPAAAESEKIGALLAEIEGSPHRDVEVYWDFTHSHGEVEAKGMKFPSWGVAEAFAKGLKYGPNANVTVTITA